MSNASNHQSADMLGEFEYKRKAHDAAFHSFGTYCIFKKRYDRYKFKILVVSAINVLVPTLFGAIYISFGVNILNKEISVALCAILGFISICTTVMSFVLRWQEKVNDSQRNMIDNYYMYERYKGIADDLTLDKEKFEFQYYQLMTEGKYIDRHSLEGEIGDKEKRWGHKKSLIQFQRSCAGCGIKPDNMVTSDCSICGQF